MPIDNQLTIAPFPAGLRALTLFLHGGAERGHRPVDGRSLSLRRSSAMLRSIAPSLAADGVGSALLRFGVKGWNAGGGVPSPVPDAREALARLQVLHPGVPVILLGHSMGARTAAWVADAPNVIGVVGLAPWFPKDDPVDALRGKHLVAAHGSRDRITSPRHTRRFLERAEQVTASAQYRDVAGLGHYMLRGASRWNEIAITSVLELAAQARPDHRDVSDDVGGITRGN